jgi:hypothetical protein
MTGLDSGQQGPARDLEAMIRDVADRQAIQETIQHFYMCIDQRDYETLARLVADKYESVNTRGVRTVSSRDEVVANSRAAYANPAFVTQHLLGLAVISTEGDTAEAMCYLQANHILPNTWGGERWELAGRCVFRLVRNEDGWQIAGKTNEPGWVDGNAKVIELAHAGLSEFEASFPPSSPPTSYDRKVGRLRS